MDKIAVLDFGCQYTQQLANVVRKAGVFSEILPFDISYDELVRMKQRASTNFLPPQALMCR